MEKFIAIKIKDTNNWFWFMEEKVKRENGMFTGRDGWGKDGAYTNLTVKEELIEGEIVSEELQYC